MGVCSSFLNGVRNLEEECTTEVKLVRVSLPKAPPQTKPKSNPVGVSADFVRDFLGNIKTTFPDHWSELTTKDVCDLLIIPRTNGANEAYIDYLQKENPSYLGEATVFISHAWRYKIVDILQTLLEYAEENSLQPPFFWFDLFINNQNIAQDLPQTWWTTTFMDSIKSIGKVLLVLSPWDDPIPLTRAWCLWEIYCSLSQTGVEFIIRLPLAEDENLCNAIVENFDSVVNTLVRVQAERAEAWNPKDKEMIFTAIEKTIGFSELNAKVKDQIRSWCITKATSSDQAIPYFLKSLEINRHVSGIKTATTLLHLRSAYDQQHDHKRAIRFFLQALPLALSEVGEKHSTMISLYTNLGLAYTREHKYVEALESHEKARSVGASLTHDSHELLAPIYNNIGGVHHTLHNTEVALENFSKAVSIAETTWGTNHPTTAMAYNSIGQSHQQNGDHDTALKFFIRAHDIFVETFGEKHTHTATVYQQMGESYLAKANPQEVVVYFKKALSLRSSLQRDPSIQVAASHSRFGAALLALECFEDAKHHLAIALQLCLSNAGEKHEWTASTHFTLGKLFISLNNRADAIHHLTCATSTRLALFGKDHPLTRETQDLLKQATEDEERT
eukprot:gene8610-1024_t